MALYDESHNDRPRNVFFEHVTRPFKRAVDLVRNRVDDLRVAMDTPAFLDQYPANAVPYTFSKLYDFGLTTPRQAPSGAGFERRATLVGNLLVVLCGGSAPQPVLNTGSLYT